MLAEASTSSSWVLAVMNGLLASLTGQAGRCASQFASYGKFAMAMYLIDVISKFLINEEDIGLKQISMPCIFSKSGHFQFYLINLEYCYNLIV
jgi:hypothetical protein